MKRIIVILLFTVYAISAVGIAVNFHYCRGRLAYVSILNFDSKTSCPLDITKPPKACCKDQLFYQNLDRHNVVEVISITEFIYFAIDPFSENHILKYNSGSNIHQSLVILSDRSNPEPIYLLNRILLI